jgi:hypothetical protein
MENQWYALSWQAVILSEAKNLSVGFAPGSDGDREILRFAQNDSRLRR